jgi:hypothetical protein
MSKKNINKIEFKHGGARPGAGHPKTGATKAKICVSVDKRNWNTAVKRWKDKPSRLVDWLVSGYVSAAGNTLEGRGAI